MSSLANGNSSFAHGISCVAGGANSIALGRQCNAIGKGSFVWNPSEGAAGYGKSLADDGIFAVNPVNGTKGFYIGNQTLSAIISSAIEAALKAKGL